MAENWIQSSLDERLFYMTGDLFDIENKFDGIAAFIPCGFAQFKFTCRQFIESNPPINMVVDPNERDRIYTINEASVMVTRSLDMLFEHGAKTIGMNAIRVDEGPGSPERVMVDSCVHWLKANPHANITIVLVDLRGGFKRYCS